MLQRVRGDNGHSCVDAGSRMSAPPRQGRGGVVASEGVPGVLDDRDHTIVATSGHKVTPVPRGPRRVRGRGTRGDSGHTSVATVWPKSESVLAGQRGLGLRLGLQGSLELPTCIDECVHLSAVPLAKAS